MARIFSHKFLRVALVWARSVVLLSLPFAVATKYLFTSDGGDEEEDVEEVRDEEDQTGEFWEEQGTLGFETTLRTGEGVLHPDPESLSDET